MSRSVPVSPYPQLKGNKVAMRILMLDGSVKTFSVPTKAIGHSLWEEVAKSLGLIEADYFDLEFIDYHTGNQCWLEHDKQILKQFHPASKDFTFRFSVKFYPPDPALFEDELTRYLFALQIKQDLVSGRLICNDNTAALLASYILQADLGDFNIQEQVFLNENKLIPTQTPQLANKIMHYHKKHLGMSASDAEFHLLDVARKVELYGMTMHPARDHEGVPLNLAVAHLGVLVFQKNVKINTFSWAKIRKLSFKRRKFLVKLHPEGYGYYKDTVEFYFDSRDDCKNFWKKCIEHHTFFRCHDNAPRAHPGSRPGGGPAVASVIIPRSSGSKFRYYGRTQKELQQFAKSAVLQRRAFLSEPDEIELNQNIFSSPSSVVMNTMPPASVNLHHHHFQDSPHQLSSSATYYDVTLPPSRYPGYHHYNQRNVTDINSTTLPNNYPSSHQLPYKKYNNNNDVTTINNYSDNNNVINYDKHRRYRNEGDYHNQKIVNTTSSVMNSSNVVNHDRQRNHTGRQHSSYDSDYTGDRRGGEVIAAKRQQQLFKQQQRQHSVDDAKGNYYNEKNVQPRDGLRNVQDVPSKTISSKPHLPSTTNDGASLKPHTDKHDDRILVGDKQNKGDSVGYHMRQYSQSADEQHDLGLSNRQKSNIHRNGDISGSHRGRSVTSRYPRNNARFHASARKAATSGEESATQDEYDILDSVFPSSNQQRNRKIVNHSRPVADRSSLPYQFTDDEKKPEELPQTTNTNTYIDSGDTIGHDAEMVEHTKVFHDDSLSFNGEQTPQHIPSLSASDKMIVPLSTGNYDDAYDRSTHRSSDRVPPPVIAKRKFDGSPMPAHYLELGEDTPVHQTADNVPSLLDFSKVSDNDMSSTSSVNQRQSRERQRKPSPRKQLIRSEQTVSSEETTVLQQETPKKDSPLSVPIVEGSVHVLSDKVRVKKAPRSSSTAAEKLDVSTEGEKTVRSKRYKSETRVRSSLSTEEKNLDQPTFSHYVENSNEELVKTTPASSASNLIHSTLSSRRRELTHKKNEFFKGGSVTSENTTTTKSSLRSTASSSMESSASSIQTSSKQSPSSMQARKQRVPTKHHLKVDSLTELESSKKPSTGSQQHHVKALIHDDSSASRSSESNSVTPSTTPKRAYVADTPANRVSTRLPREAEIISQQLKKNDDKFGVTPPKSSSLQNEQRTDTTPVSNNRRRRHVAGDIAHPKTPTSHVISSAITSPSLDLRTQIRLSKSHSEYDYMRTAPARQKALKQMILQQHRSVGSRTGNAGTAHTYIVTGTQQKSPVLSPTDSSSRRLPSSTFISRILPSDSSSLTGRTTTCSSQSSVESSKVVGVNRRQRPQQHSLSGLDDKSKHMVPSTFPPMSVAAPTSPKQTLSHSVKNTENKVAKDDILLTDKSQSPVKDLDDKELINTLNDKRVIKISSQEDSDVADHSSSDLPVIPNAAIVSKPLDVSPVKNPSAVSASSCQKSSSHETESEKGHSPFSKHRSESSAPAESKTSPTSDVNRSAAEITYVLRRRYCDSSKLESQLKNDNNTAASPSNFEKFRTFSFSSQMTPSNRKKRGKSVDRVTSSFDRDLDYDATTISTELIDETLMKMLRERYGSYFGETNGNLRATIPLGGAAKKVQKTQSKTLNRCLSQSPSHSLSPNRSRVTAKRHKAHSHFSRANANVSQIEQQLYATLPRGPDASPRLQHMSAKDDTVKKPFDIYEIKRQLLSDDSLDSPWSHSKSEQIDSSTSSSLIRRKTRSPNLFIHYQKLPSKDSYSYLDDTISMPIEKALLKKYLQEQSKFFTSALNKLSPAASEKIHNNEKTEDNEINAMTKSSGDELPSPTQYSKDLFQRKIIVDNNSSSNTVIAVTSTISMDELKCSMSSFSSISLESDERIATTVTYSLAPHAKIESFSSTNGGTTTTTTTNSTSQMSPEESGENVFDGNEAGDRKSSSKEQNDECDEQQQLLYINHSSIAVKKDTNNIVCYDENVVDGDTHTKRMICYDDGADNNTEGNETGEYGEGEEGEEENQILYYDYSGNETGASCESLEDDPPTTIMVESADVKIVTNLTVKEIPSTPPTTTMINDGCCLITQNGSDEPTDDVDVNTADAKKMGLNNINDNTVSSTNTFVNTIHSGSTPTSYYQVKPSTTEIPASKDEVKTLTIDEDEVTDNFPPTIEPKYVDEVVNNALSQAKMTIVQTSSGCNVVSSPSPKIKVVKRLNNHREEKSEKNQTATKDGILKDYIAPGSCHSDSSSDNGGDMKYGVVPFITSSNREDNSTTPDDVEKHSTVPVTASASIGGKPVVSESTQKVKPAIETFYDETDDSEDDVERESGSSTSDTTSDSDDESVESQPYRAGSYFYRQALSERSKSATSSSYSDDKGKRKRVTTTSLVTSSSGKSPLSTSSIHVKIVDGHIAVPKTSNDGHSSGMNENHRPGDEAIISNPYAHDSPPLTMSSSSKTLVSQSNSDSENNFSKQKDDRVISKEKNESTPVPSGTSSADSRTRTPSPMKKKPTPPPKPVDLSARHSFFSFSTAETTTPSITLSSPPSSKSVITSSSTNVSSHRTSEEKEVSAMTFSSSDTSVANTTSSTYAEMESKVREDGGRALYTSDKIVGSTAVDSTNHKIEGESEGKS